MNHPVGAWGGTPDKGWVVLDCRMVRHTGVGTYIRAIFPHLPEIGGGYQYLTLRNAGLPAVGTWPALNVRSQPLGLSNHLLGWELRGLKVGLLHVPFFNVPVTWSGRLVVTIHDLIPLTVPGTIESPAKLWAFKLWVQIAARKADVITTVSEHSRLDIIRLLDVPPAKVTVVPPAAESHFRPAVDGAAVDALRRRLGADRFFLYVGRAKPHKNLPRLLRAFRSASAQSPCMLVIAGPQPPPADLIRDVRDLGLANSVRLVGYVSDEDLPVYYQAATAVVLPSLYEGFGLPALEGMACGTPAIGSTATAVPEVIGDAGLLVDPRNEGAIAEAMVRVATDADLRRALRERGLARVGVLSPKVSAQRLVDLYYRVLTGRWSGRE